MASVKPTSRRLRRGPERVIGGVCYGVAEMLDLDPVVVRIAFVLLAFLNGIGLLLYALLWILVPEAGREEPWTVSGAANSIGKDVSRMGADLKSALQPAAVGATPAPPAPVPAPSADPVAPALATAPPSASVAAARPLWPGILLIVLGAVLLAGAFGWSWWIWTVAGPALLIAAGVWLLLRRTR